MAVVLIVNDARLTLANQRWPLRRGRFGQCDCRRFSMLLVASEVEIAEHQNQHILVLYSTFQGRSARTEEAALLRCSIRVLLQHRPSYDREW